MDREIIFKGYGEISVSLPSKSYPVKLNAFNIETVKDVTEGDIKTVNQLSRLKVFWATDKDRKQYGNGLKSVDFDKTNITGRAEVQKLNSQVVSKEETKKEIKYEAPTQKQEVGNDVELPEETSQVIPNNEESKEKKVTFDQLMKNNMAQLQNIASKYDIDTTGMTKAQVSQAIIAKME